MAVFTRKDREAVGTATLVFALLAAVVAFAAVAGQLLAIVAR